MSHIVIKSGTAHARTIKRKDGTLMQFREQKAAIEAGEDFPRPFTLTLDDDQAPYSPGNYNLDPSCLEVGDFDALKVGRRVKLLPISPGKA